MSGPSHTDTASTDRERAILVKLITPENAGQTDARNPLGELQALAEAAGAEVVDALLQKRMGVHPKTHIGKGKLAELTERVEANEANLIIFDDELTPAQIRSVEKATTCRVIDRSELILDIFASRAQTHEARLQVEIAQLEYTAPRLRGMWTHLERVAGVGGASSAGVVGGIGTRGPGERQIEIDRRIVRDRVSFLRREIKQIDRRKVREVQSRRDEMAVSLVGYTNAGKSTLMNALTDANQDMRDMLFATLDTKTARWQLGQGRHVLLSDTVGFVRNLPHKLVASFRATLEEAIHADLLLHVVDISSRNALREIEVVGEVLNELGCAEKPMLTLLNKMDAAEDEALISIALEKHHPAAAVSARTGQGLDEVANFVLARLHSAAVRAVVRLPAGDGRLLTLLGQLGEVHDQQYTGTVLEMDVTIDRTQFDQLCARHPQLTVVRKETVV